MSAIVVILGIMCAVSTCRSIYGLIQDIKRVREVKEVRHNLFELLKEGAYEGNASK